MSEKFDGKIQLPALPESVDIPAALVTIRQELEAGAEAITAITGQAEFSRAEIILKQITTYSNKMDESRKSLAKPFSDAAKKIKEASDSWRNPLEAHKTRLKMLMSDYLREEQRKQAEAAEAQRQAEAAAAEDDPFGAEEEALPAQPEPPQTFRAMTSVREIFTFEIVNPELVDRQYCSPDERKIREYLAGCDITGPDPELPGIVVKKETKIQSR